jgi:outer membrane protein OmpA-like peptidoglycan-associated protein
MKSALWPVGVVALMGSPVSAQPAKYTNPDDPRVKAAARAALANATVVDILAETRDILGQTTGIDGLLKDLGAQVTGNQIRIPVAADVLFDYDSAALRPEASGTLTKIADVLKQYSDDAVLVEGHTDGKGTAQYNQGLSERRAAAVKTWLVATGGIADRRITTKGWGATKPVAPNATAAGQDDEAGRRRNRRVEIVVSRAK